MPDINPEILGGLYKTPAKNYQGNNTDTYRLALELVSVLRITGT